MENADSSGHRVQDDILGALKFPDAKVARALVEAKANVHGLNKSLEVLSVEISLLDQRMLIIVERKIITKKSESLTCPCAGICRSGNHIVADTFLQPSLGIFSNTGSSKDSKASPVVDCVLSTKEGIQVI